VGVRYRIPVKERGGPFQGEGLNAAFAEGYIDRAGRLTRLGMAHIRANLYALAEYGKFFIARESGRRVIDVATMMKKARSLPRRGVPADPFAPPTPTYEEINAVFRGIAGEDYRDLIVSEHGGTLAVTTQFGETITISY